MSCNKCRECNKCNNSCDNRRGYIICPPNQANYCDSESSVQEHSECDRYKHSYSESSCNCEKSCTCRSSYSENESKKDHSRIGCPFFSSDSDFSEKFHIKQSDESQSSVKYHKQSDESQSSVKYHKQSDESEFNVKNDESSKLFNESQDSARSYRIIKDKKAEKSETKDKKFIVGFGPKEGHVWDEYNKGETSIYINGKNGPVLHLYRGYTYFFCLEPRDSKQNPLNSFVLTNSPIGGESSNIIPNGFTPISEGCVCFKVDECTPRYFYYQDSKQEFSGGLIIVHDIE